MTLKECVGIVAGLSIAFIVYAFVKAASMLPRDEEPSEGTVILHHHAVDYDALEHGTNGKARVEVRRE